MPVTLAQAALNTQDDLESMIIDEFRKNSSILDTLIFHDAVSPMGGGATLTYGYHRHVTERGAGFRAINSEYAKDKAEKARFSVDLKPLGGTFEIDRVLAQVARGAEVSYQLTQLVKATRARFTDELVNGDVAQNADGFDGLSEALGGTDTEVDASGLPQGDWSNLDDNYHGALDTIDEWFSVLDGAPTMVIGNSRALAKFRAIARRANQFVERPVEGLTDGSGAPITREFYGNTLLVDAGEKAGSADPIIPITSGGLAADNGLTDLYAVRVGMDGFHGVTVSGQELVRSWLPDFTTAGAVKVGEVEMGPVATALKATKAASVLRGIRVVPEAT